MRLINGDSAEVLRKIKDGVIDLTVTSPPYDNLRTYEGSLVWDFDVFKSIADELYRVTKTGGVVVWVVGDATVKGSETGTSFRQALYFKEIRFNLHDTMVWQKSKMPLNHDRYEQNFEYMFVLSKGKPQTFNGLRDKPNAESGAKNHISYRDKDGTTKKTSSYNKTTVPDFGLRYNVWSVPACTSSKERTGHPAQFPEKLAEDHILSWSNEGDTVMDPFLGSGTTGAMALKNGRKFLGIEKVKKYYDIAVKRLEQPINGAKQC